MDENWPVCMAIVNMFSSIEFSSFHKERDRERKRERERQIERQKEESCAWVSCSCLEMTKS